jgi:antitoxin VapB
MIATAKVFTTGRSQAVRLPKEFRFDEDEVCIKKIGRTLYLYPKSKVLEIFESGAKGFSEDFMENGRAEWIESLRERIFQNNISLSQNKNYINSDSVVDKDE